MNESLVDCLDTACFIYVWNGADPVHEQEAIVQLLLGALLKALSSSLTMEAFKHHNFKRSLGCFPANKFRKDATLLGLGRRRSACPFRVLSNDHLNHIILKHYRNLLCQSEARLEFTSYLGQAERRTARSAT